jgi:chromosome segregation ATPase
MGGGFAASACAFNKRKKEGEQSKMSKKSEETKEKTEETKTEAAKAEEKPEGTKDEAAEAEEKSAEIEEIAAEAEEKPAEAKEKAAKAEEKQEESKAEVAKAEKKPSTAKEKPLEKMTVKEMREMAKDIPGITGVHAMKKDELIVEIKKAKGIKDEPIKKADASIAELKQKIKALKSQRRDALEAKDKKQATIFKRRISRLKKKTRRAAA